MEYLLKIDNREKDIIKRFGIQNKTIINEENVEEILENTIKQQVIKDFTSNEKNYEILFENLDIGDIQIIDNTTKEIIIIIFIVFIK